MRKGAHAKNYKMAIMWLSNCGLVHKISRINSPNIPLKAYENLKTFKLFLADVGLLSCMVGLQQSVLLDLNDLFKEFKGSLTEQYVMQQLVEIPNFNTYYYAITPTTSAHVRLILSLITVNLSSMLKSNWKSILKPKISKAMEKNLLRKFWYELQWRTIKKKSV